MRDNRRGTPPTRLVPRSDTLASVGGLLHIITFITTICLYYVDIAPNFPFHFAICGVNRSKIRIMKIISNASNAKINRELESSSDVLAVIMHKVSIVMKRGEIQPAIVKAVKVSELHSRSILYLYLSTKISRYVTIII